ncbi:MAG TPA: RNA ligase family protein [Thermoanaerobaculia bacterium]|nr:RNA ligase family protein [Thermoanaerobaculia bacterium]
MPACRYKYPRTPHLPWSPGASPDDLLLDSLDCFSGREVVITEKLDGENTTLYPEGLHARSIDSRHHPSRDWVKSLHGSIRHLIPAGFRVCGENLYARHSIAYEGLRSYFYVFSIWNQDNLCLGWDETLEWSELLGLEVVPTLLRGRWDETATRALALDFLLQEGYVVRTTAAFAYDDFGRHVAKWVRTGHVQTDEHWMFSEVVPNRLAAGEER